MEIIKKTVTTEVEEKIVSCDGKFERYITDAMPKERAQRDVEEYEKKLGTVLWQRLVDRGLIREINRYCGIPTEKLTPEQRWERAMFHIADTMVDSGCENYNYFVFCPKTEEDIVAILTYSKACDDGEDMWFPSDENEDYILSCTRKRFEPGHKYLYCEHCDGYRHLYRLDDLKIKFSKFVDGLEELND